MKLQLLAAMSLACIANQPVAAQEGDGFKRLQGAYQIYGGSLEDRTDPTAKDKKIVIVVSGSAAKDIFDAIGPDKKDVCTEGSGIRIRKKDNENLVCTRSEKGEYSCNFGFDLMSGKSIGGSLC